MTALPKHSLFLLPSAQIAALSRARAATPDYCTSVSSEALQVTLRDLTPLEAMYAYFGSDVAD